MLDEYFNFEEVNRLMFDLETNPKYYNKKIKDGNHLSIINSNLTLYLFYDAVFKYKILVDDIYLFNEYVDNLNKIFRKIDNIEDITKGINKLLCNLLSVTLNLSEIESENKKTIVKTIYDRYIVNGYYIHGFPTIYEESIFRNGIRSGIYENYYPYMRNVDNIFSRHGVKNIFNKDFVDKSMYFTDDLAMACYYSSIAPGYYSYFLLNDLFSNKNKIEDYQHRNFFACFEGIEKYLDRSNYSNYDKDMILKVIKNEWKYLGSTNKRVSLLLIPRKLINSDCPKFESIYDDSYNLYEMVDDILGLRYGDVKFNGLVESNNIEILSFYYPMIEVKEPTTVKVRDEKVEQHEKPVYSLKQLDTYGVVSFLIILGSLLISLGIIASIIVIGGI